MKQLVVLASQENTKMDNQAAAPGMLWTQIAASAYRAYTASIRGEPMPGWEALPVAIQVAWEAAVRQAAECLHLGGDQQPPDESFWTNWKPSWL